MLDKAVRNRIRPLVRRTDSRFYPAPRTASYNLGNAQVLELDDGSTVSPAGVVKAQSEWSRTLYWCGRW